MKKELVELKENTAAYINAVNEFVAERDNFSANLDVNALAGLANYYDEECENAYDVAKNFFMINGDVADLAAEIKSEHPKYGQPRFKGTLVTAVIAERDSSYEEAQEVVETYLALEEAGYSVVRRAEENISVMAEKVNSSTGEVVTQGKEAVTKVASTVATKVGKIAKPYGEVAKGQLKEASVAAKGLVNKGTKRLIKTLEKIEEKTK